jgi:hypothetical protein
MTSGGFGGGDGGGDMSFNRVHVLKAELMAKVEKLGESLPANTLDTLIDQLGGPDMVAEMTGRKGRVVTKESGSVQYELRRVDTDATDEMLNMVEKERFMNGDKVRTCAGAFTLE